MILLGLARAGSADSNDCLHVRKNARVLPRIHVPSDHYLQYRRRGKKWQLNGAPILHKDWNAKLHERFRATTVPREQESRITLRH